MDRADALKRLSEPTLEAMGFEVVRVLVMGQQRATLQVMIERADRAVLTVDHCAEASRVLSAVLDVEDPIQGAYTLEVSSPGIDRPLTRLADFERFAGHLARVETARPVDGRRRFKGWLAGVDGDAVRLTLSEAAPGDAKQAEAAPGEANREGPAGDAAAITVPFADIQRAKLVLTDALIAAAGGVG